MPVDVVIPELGESITEAVIASWLRADGDYVAMDEPIAELETDKATVELPAPAAGTLNVTAEAGATVQVGDTIARIEPGDPASPKRSAPAPTPAAPEPEPAQSRPQAPPPAPPAPPAQASPNQGAAILSPAARRLVEEHGLDAEVIAATGRGGRITKADVLAHLDSTAGTATPAAAKTPTPIAAAASAPATTGRLSPGLALIRSTGGAAAPSAGATVTPITPVVPIAPATAPAPVVSEDEVERVAMTPMRRTIASRLLGAQQNAAILTTFNEIDMTAVMELRKRYKQQFSDTHGVNLGFMSFFSRASVLAAADVPAVNGRIENNEIVYNKRVHLGIAASTPKGLVVPVVKGADSMSLAELEREIGRLAGIARDGKLSMADMSGGTFTISNGGVFGSLMSTPILNPPQSGILGLHKIEKRAVVVDDEIVIRPMMYVALSYDHRLVDGREAVTFLVRIKERIEDPQRMLLGV